MLNLHLLEQRQLLGHLIETFIILKGIENVDAAVLYQRAITSKLRGHDMKTYMT